VALLVGKLVDGEISCLCKVLVKVPGKVPGKVGVFGLSGDERHHVDLRGP
jgi:hypothetical protein